MMTTATKRTLTAGLAGLTLLLAGACAKPQPPLTPDGTDRYVFTDTATDAVRVDAPATNTGGQLRQTWSDDQAHPSTDGESCATWSDQSSWIDQEGAALRIATGADGLEHALTVTKNVYSGATWLFNVHTFDGAQYTQLARFDLAATFEPDGTTASIPAFPWSMCAKVENTTLSFVVWPAGQPRPAYGDPAYGGTVTVPAADVRAGDMGWYVGHLQPGEHVAYTGLTTTPLP